MITSTDGPGIILHNQSTVQNLYLHTLPAGALGFEEFQKKFSLGNASTEQLHPITKNLSQVMHEDIRQGLEVLIEADLKVLEGMAEFTPFIQIHAPIIKEKLVKGGRVFIIGSGSSGRVGIDIAAKCVEAFPEMSGKILGILAGGDSAMVKPRENFEDSAIEGEKALSAKNLGPNDTVILLSASGSASFNLGCGHYAASEGASVLYFYNNKNTPSDTLKLFQREKNPITPLCIDIGPQAIAGSTRLQAATLAEGCLGSLLASALFLKNGEKEKAEEYPERLINNMSHGLNLCKNYLSTLSGFIQTEEAIFSHPNANFRQAGDIYDQGYVTFLAGPDCIRETLIDTSETSPTFSTNPPRTEKETQKRRPEFQAYLVGNESDNLEVWKLLLEGGKGPQSFDPEFLAYLERNESDNLEAWKVLLGRDIDPQSLDHVKEFLLSSEAYGINSYQNRPKGNGNLVIGVAKINNSEDTHSKIISELDKIEGSKGLILLCKEALPIDKEYYYDKYPNVLILHCIPDDPLGISQTILLKQVLNLISNGSMIMMNKIHGNQMIDVRASNGKLLDRCMRLVKEIWSESYPDVNLDDRTLYHYILHADKLKKARENEGQYSPSIVKIILTMLALGKTPEHFDEVVKVLADNKESIIINK